MIKMMPATLGDVQKEYNRLFCEEPIRDEDRGYRWLAGQLMSSKPGIGSLLDLACGGGYFLSQVRDLAGPEAVLTGIDLSTEAIRLARRQCAPARYLVGAGESLPFRDASFDAITCLGSLEHFLDISRALSEMKRVAKPDAVFLILVPNLFWYKDILAVLASGDRKTRNQTHERFACLGEWKKLLNDGGLEVRRTLKYNGIARRPFKQRLKDLLIPLKFSYHFLFICSKGKPDGRIAQRTE